MEITFLPWIENLSDNISWAYLSKNIHAIPILEKNLDKVDWFHLSSNMMAVFLLAENRDKIVWESVYANPNIFRCDYDYYKKRMDIHREELMKNVFHPRRLANYLELGYDMFDID